MALILPEIHDTDRFGPIRILCHKAFGSWILEFCLKTEQSFIAVRQSLGTKVKNHKMQQLISMK